MLILVAYQEIWKYPTGILRRIDPLSSSEPSATCEYSVWAVFELENENVQPVLTINKAMHFKDETKDGDISSFINNPPSTSHPAYQVI